MAAYVIAQLDINDREGFERYRAMVPPTLKQFGGRYIVRGGRHEALEGEYNPQRVVVIEFPSYEQAKAWWACAEYAEAKALRQRTADTRLVIVEGVEGGG
jgi:uncharacterized protein (DUF1330 family)